MAASVMKRLVLAAGLSAAGCTVDLSVPASATVSCATNGECPGSLICDARQGLCVKPGETSAEVVAYNAAPVAALGAVAAEEGDDRPAWRVRIAFVLSDNNGAPNGDETVSVDVAYALDYDAGTGAGTWYPATPAASSPSVRDLSADAGGSPHAFIWDALADASDGVKGLAAAFVDTTGDGLLTEMTVAFTPSVHVRIWPRDQRGLAGAAAVSSAFALGNDLPVVALERPTGTLRGEVPLAFIISDSASDSAGIDLEFRQHGSDAWRRAIVSLGAIRNLTTSVDGLSNVIIWSSTSALAADPDTPQGPGLQNLVGLQLRMRSFDQATGTVHYGPWTDPVRDLALTNETVPLVRGLAVRAEQGRVIAGNLPVVYKLVDAESDPVDVGVEYSTDAGSTWHSCTELRTPHSEGTERLMSEPTSTSGADGIQHVFIWDSPAELDDSFAGACLIRVTPRDTYAGLGASAVVDAGDRRAVTPPGAATTESLGRRTSFASASQVFANTPTMFDALSADVDSDSIFDIVGLRYVNNSTHHLVVLAGNGDDGIGDGTFHESWAAAIGIPGKLVAGDFNRDGILDVALTAYGTSSKYRLEIWTGTGAHGAGDGGFTRTFVFDALECGSGLRVTDANGDGLLDVWLDLKPIVGLLLGIGDGTFAFPMPFPVPFGLSDVADLDQDGWSDLLTGSANPEVDFAGTAGGNWNHTFVDPTLLGAGVEVAVDLNQDGIPDLAGAGYGIYVVHADPSTTPGVGRRAYTYVEADDRYVTEGSVARLLDFNDDGVLDVAASSGATSNVVLRFGLSDLGLATARLGLAAQFAASPTFDAVRAAVAADFTGDGQPDYLPLTNTLTWQVLSGRRETATYRWSRVATLFGSMGGTNDMDLFGRPVTGAIALRRFHGEGEDGPGDYRQGKHREGADLLRMLRESRIPLPRSLVPLTDPWLANGDVRLTPVRLPSIAGVVDAGLRLMVANRFGALSEAASRWNPQRQGLDLSATATGGQRGVVIDLPMLAPRADALGATPTITVRVYRRSRTWVRATEFAADPLYLLAHGSTPTDLPLGALLPKRLHGDSYATVFSVHDEWHEVPRAPSDNLANGAGPRFAVDLTAKTVHVLMDELGALQAFLSYAD